MNKGDVIKLNGIDLLVLDTFDNGDAFVLAHNLSEDMDTPFNFSGDGNRYATSLLRKKMESWLDEQGFKTRARILDLTTMDGYAYNAIEVDVAPLTFDEFRKYASIIQPKVTHDFWLATGWGHDGWAANRACLVCSDGKPTSSTYNVSFGFAPAFILEKSVFDKPDIQNFSTKELIAEIERRTLAYGKSKT